MGGGEGRVKRKEKDVPSALMQCPKHGSCSSQRHMSEAEQINTDHQHFTVPPGLHGGRFENCGVIAAFSEDAKCQT